VVVTNGGEPAFVLLGYDTYRCLTGERAGSLVDMLRQNSGNFCFDPPRLRGDCMRVAKPD